MSDVQTPPEKVLTFDATAIMTTIILQENKKCLKRQVLAIKILLNEWDYEEWKTWKGRK